MDNNAENDLYCIPSVPRCKRDLAANDFLNDTIGDRFFELNFGDKLQSPLPQLPTPKVIRTSIAPLTRSSTRFTPQSKENIPPPKTAIPQSTMQLRSGLKLDSKPESLPPVVRTRRSRSLIKPGRPSIDTGRTVNPVVSVIEQPKVQVVQSSGSIFARKNKEVQHLTAPNLDSKQALARPRRSRSLIKPGRPSMDTGSTNSIARSIPVPKSTTISVPKSLNVAAPKSTTDSSSKSIFTTATASRFVMPKSKNELPSSFNSTPTKSKRRSSYMDPTFSSAQRGQFPSSRV